MDDILELGYKLLTFLTFFLLNSNSFIFSYILYSALLYHGRGNNNATTGRKEQKETKSVYKFCNFMIFKYIFF